MGMISTGKGVRAGALAYFAESSAPTGYLKANGAAISRTLYAGLFAAIGTTFGAGDGSTTFNIPDLRGEFVRGFDDGRGVDSGRVIGGSQQDALQGHRHSFTPFYGAKGVGGNMSGTGHGIEQAIVGNPTADGANGEPRTAAETRPRNVALLACIKY